jgi:hypothetical protein
MNFAAVITLSLAMVANAVAEVAAFLINTCV